MRVVRLLVIITAITTSHPSSDTPGVSCDFYKNHSRFVACMDALQQSILRFLFVVHHAPKALGTEELARTLDVPDARTLYRWQDEFADDLIYFPSVSFRALGLDHWHLFIDNPNSAWEEFEYAISGEWVTNHPGQRTLYLHCLAPAKHRAEFQQLLDDLHGCTHLHAMRTDDGWQVMRDLTDAASELDLVPTPALRDAPAVWDVIERFPLLIPVIFENVERRHTLPELWRRIYDRLGDRTWSFLPAGANRLPNNGKMYIKDAYALLNHTRLFRQNVIRYRPLDVISTTMFLHLHSGDLRSSISAFGKQASTLDVYPITDTEVLLRVTATHATMQYVMSSMSELPRITDWFLVDALHPQRITARFAYEQLFDPLTTEWLFPREEIMRRLQR